MKGEVERARELSSDARQVYVDAGLRMTAATFAQGGAEIAFRAGDLHGEEAVLRDSLEILEGIGDRGFYSTQALWLAECLYRAGAEDTRDRGAGARRRARRPPPTISSTSSGSTWSAGCSTHGAASHEQAEQCSRRAVALAETGDFHNARSFSRAYLAEVLALSGRADEAAEVAAEAFEIFEAKGDVAGWRAVSLASLFARRRGRLIAVAERYDVIPRPAAGRIEVTTPPGRAPSP